MPSKKTGTRIVYSAIGVFSAILGNIVYFVVLARQWLPEEFGYFLYIYSLATLLTLVIDYGFPQRVLREVPLFTYRNKINMVKGLSTKALATILMVTFAVMYSFFVDNNELLTIIITATVMGSFADYFSSHLKALHLHKLDSLNLFTINSALVITLLLITAASSRALTLNEAALMLLFSKTGYLLSSGILVSKNLRLRLHSVNIRIFPVPSELKIGASYAIDVALIRSYGILDTIMLRYFAGDSATGIYQSGQRLLQGFLPLAQVYNNVFLPLLSRSHGTIRHRRQAIILLTLSIITGVFGYLLLHYAGQYIVNFIFGNKYIAVLPYLSAFGLIILLRFITSGIAILLTASGNQSRRTILNATSLVILIVSMIALGESHGTWGIIYSILISNAFLITAYFILLLNSRTF